MSFETLLFIFIMAVTVLGSAFASFVFFSLSGKEERAEKFGAVARNKFAGAILSAAALVWIVPNVEPILPVGSFLRLLLWPLVPVALVLCIVFLDFLTARAAAALAILLSHYLLKETFPMDLGFDVVFKICLFILGIAGMIFAAKPHYFREVLKRSAKSAVLRYSFGIYFAVLAISSASASIYGIFFK